MKKILTLKKNYEFKYTLNKGKVYYGNQIIVYIIRNKSNTNILGIAINTKLGKAVIRNKVKRLIRENYRIINNDLRQGYNVVFLWNKKTNIKQADYFEIKKDMQNIFKKAKMLNYEKNNNFFN